MTEAVAGKVAIVIGATGLVGNALVEQLAQAPHIGQVIAITRRPVDYGSDKICNQVVDFDQLEKTADVFKGDILFSCLGTTRKQAGSLEAQRIVDVDYQYRAAQLAAKQGVSHYLLVSSSGANVQSSSGYMKMKGELEQAIEKLGFPRVSILQPSLLLGTRDHLRVGEMIGSWLLPALCLLPGLRRYRPIRGEQVAATMVKLSGCQGQGLERLVLDQVFS
ncbi:oxidoreductase [Maricurvus nonylphenolicus]|uniref:NAD(P)H-binding protein n=1 Tax=Maricurvus nonylphenolicus TaxID=1008307 RepID=UPI0036F26305